MRALSAVAAGVPAARRIPAPVGLSLAGKVAEMATLLALAALVPRVLGPADYGQFAVALTIVTIGSLSMALGGPTLMARFVPAAAPEQRAAVARALGLRLALVRCPWLVAIAVAAAALAAWDPARFPALPTALVVLALALNVAATLSLQTGLGLGGTTAWSLRYPLQNAVIVVAAVALYPVAGAIGALVAIALGSLAAFALGVGVVGPLVRRPARPATLPTGALRFATLQAVSGALVQLAHRGGVIVVAVVVGAQAQTGYAALALGVALAATYAVLQAFTVSLPALAARREDPAAGEAALRRLAGLALAVVLPAAIAGALVLEPALPAVFGAGFEAAAPAFAPALAFVVLAPVNALAQQVAALRLRPEASLWSAVAGAVAFAAVAAVAVPGWEAAGAVAAALAGAAAAAITSMVVLPGGVGAGLGAASLGGAATVLSVALAV